MSRPSWKIPYVSSIFLRNSFINSEKYDTYVRNSIITNDFINKRIRVYSGKAWVSFIVTDDMVGKKLGEFSFTKVIGSRIAHSKYLKMKSKRKKK